MELNNREYNIIVALRDLTTQGNVFQHIDGYMSTANRSYVDAMFRIAERSPNIFEVESIPTEARIKIVNEDMFEQFVERMGD